MQRVERQKHKERKRGRLAAVLVCAVLLVAGVTAGLLLRKSAEVELPEKREPVSGFITKREAEELQSLTITRQGKEPWTVEQQADGKMMFMPADGSEAWQVDETIAGILADTASSLNFEDVLTENRADWEGTEEGFGLKDPLVTAVIRFTDGTEVTVRIGHSADPEDNASYYMTVDGDDRLFITSAGIVNDLNMEKEVLHPVKKLEIIGSLLDRITVKNGDGTVRSEWALQGNPADRDAAENWLMTKPYTYPTDYDMMKNMRRNAESLKLGTYVGEADGDNLKEYGLDKPSAILEMHTAAGDTGTVGMSGVFDVVSREEQTVILTVGNNKSDVSTYVRYEDEVYTVSRFILEVFTKAEPLTCLARYVVVTPLDSLDSVTVETQGREPVHYTVIRNAGETAQDTGEEVRGHCMRNGEEIDYNAFSAAWERLLTVTVSGRIRKERPEGAVHTKYTVNTVSGAVHTVELSDYDGIHDAVKVDGYTLFYLIKGGMTDLP